MTDGLVDQVRELLAPTNRIVVDKMKLRHTAQTGAVGQLMAQESSEPPIQEALLLTATLVHRKAGEKNLCVGQVMAHPNLLDRDQAQARILDVLP
jgi:hypothetical protein